jgi:hypothetical protein
MIENQRFEGLSLQDALDGEQNIPAQAEGIRKQAVEITDQQEVNNLLIGFSL